MSKSVSSGNVIGLMADPGPGLVAGMLGILKSGASFVPLDPHYPLERIAFLLNDCDVQTLVTEAKYRQKVGELARQSSPLRSVIYLDHAEGGGARAENLKQYDAGDIAAAARTRPAAARVGPESRAYVIYTSGSTGRPKGVPITHANLFPILTWAREYFGLGEHTRVLQNLSYCFDFGVFEILTTLLCGGTLYFVGDVRAGGPDRYDRAVAEHGINTIHTTPSYFTEIIAPDAPLRGLQILHLGGEQLTGRSLSRIREAVGERCVVYNGYGPTEASVNSTIYRVEAGVPDETSPGVPIGKPTACNKTLVLDGKLQPSPIGVPGELHVGGRGLSQGYLNRPGLTAERFVPDPYSAEPGARLYKTGDLVRHLEDGNIEFLGRLDHQVKVRGFRIELGEIEATLALHPSVREVVVVARDEARGGKRLVAYLVAEEGREPTTAELRKFLEHRLPGYMTPSAFVLLDRLPLSPNGKVDRRALPDDAGARSEPDAAYVAPRTPEEELVSEICAEVLALERVGAHDNLFELGCHSLLATAIVSRLRRAFQVELPLLAIFEAPTVAGLAESVRAARQSGSAPDVPPLVPAPRDERLPLSFAQERLWFLHQFDPESASYYIPRALRIKGPLSVRVLADTFTELVRRHEILRTTFPLVDGHPAQVVHPPYRFPVPVVDLRGLPEPRREEEARRLLVENGQQPFDLARGPMIRLSVLRMKEQEFILVLTEHHLVHDGWTQGVLVGDFLTLYTAFAAGEPSPLQDLPLQYADFAYWQRRWLRGDVLDAQLAYWKKQLAGAPPYLELPVDRPRPPVQSFRGSELTFDIEEELADALRALGRREGATLFMTMLAAFDVLLYRHTGQEDVVVGTGIANRRWHEIEGLLGMIINTLVLRCDLSGRPSFRELLHRAREVCLGAYAHQDVPFEKLVEELQPERSLSHTPVFQVLFAFMDAPHPELRLPGLDLEVIDAHNRSAKFDLNVVLIPHAEQAIRDRAAGRDGAITVLLEYNTDIFEDETIARLAARYENLLRAVVADPEARIEELPLLTREEERLLREEWNRTATDYPRELCVHQLFERQAALAPDSVALLSAEGQLTYGELNRRANQLAHFLKRAGVGPDVPVAVYLERSFDLIVALLGVLKAGGAYVPLSTADPAQRAGQLLDDTRAPVLVTRKSLADTLPAHAARVVALDRGDEGPLRGESDADPANDTHPDNLAYVMYTSGSTGRPKGVAVTHRNVVRLVKGTDYAEMTPREVFLQFAPISFDASTFEIWGSLLNGARLALMPEHIPSLRELGQAVRQYGVTTLWLTTGLFHQMVEECLEDLKPVRQLLTGGDVVSSAHARRVLELAGGGSVSDLYGPTEGTTFTTSHTMTSPDEVGSPIPIGRPIANARVYVLDPSLRPAPLGVRGELYIGGDGLARGYLNRPGLTAERFIPDPFDREGGGRLYRTGDVVRWRADGALEFVGRNDSQVKLRGFRIEVEEIESALLRHDGVGEAVVVALPDKGGDKRLVAYVAPNGRRPPSAAELRDWLADRLPGYMVPWTYLFLEKLPLTANGKVDRRALPPPDQNSADLAARYEPPRTPVEEAVAGMWAELLAVERIGVHDNFFELGGHSLAAMRLVTRMREAFQVELPLKNLFEGPTVANCASVIEQALLEKIEQLSEEEAQRLAATLFGG